MNQANYQAKVAERNAMVSGMEGATALQAGQEKASEVSLAGAQKLGRLKSELAAGNVDVNRGSNVDVLASERMGNKLAADTTMWNAERSQWGYAQQAIGQEAQATADKAAGQNALFGGILGAAGDVVGGLGKTFAPGGGGFLGGATPTAPTPDNSIANLDTGGSNLDDYFTSSSNPYSAGGAYSP